jgi:hypothetical protein
VQATPVEFGSPHVAICAGFAIHVNHSSFTRTWRPNSRCVPCVRLVWLAHAHSQPSSQTPPTVNGMRLKWPIWTSPLAKVNRRRPFIASTAYSNPHNVGFYLVVFQIHHSCLQRKLASMLHSHTGKPNLAHRSRHPRLQTPSNKQEKKHGTLSNIMQLGMSA